MKLFLALLLILIPLYSNGKSLIIHNSNNTLSDNIFSFKANSEIKIALLSSPKTIGKYSQSVFNVSLATLMSRHNDNYTIKQYDINDESTESLTHALSQINHDGMNAILAPLTLNGAKNLSLINPNIPTFIPTVHRRYISDSPTSIVFGAIDYKAQIEALLPYMSNSIAVFYDNSPVGMQLKDDTQEVFFSQHADKKKSDTYVIDAKGENIISHFSKPSSFTKRSVILHIPVVKSAILCAHMTFTGVKEQNILSTQINVDPTLLTLTQYQDRKNMILANSITEFPPAIYETNELMNNDLTYDWINYASSVGIDYLVSLLSNTPREYTMRIVNSQIIYPVELVRPKEYGFEPINEQ
ncbi:MAG: hypothetical protein PHO27_00995 [Sulfuricurvum sp.]|nr:hypothetical protein [Sulfuricurvum sp.]